MVSVVPVVIPHFLGLYGLLTAGALRILPVTMALVMGALETVEWAAR